MEELVKLLIGDIIPIGETNIDDKRFENLKEMISLVESLLREIENVSYMNKRPEYSVKRSGEFAYNFLKNLV